MRRDARVDAGVAVRSDRTSAIRSIRAALRARTSPRVHMLALVTVTAAVGFLSSVLLLRAGVTAMVVRYPASVGVSYLAFLGLVALWLRRYRLRTRVSRGRRDRLEFDVLDVPLDRLWASDAVPDVSGGGGGGGGGGGAFSGGGGGSSWGSGTPVAHGTSTPSVGHGGGLDLDVDEGVLWLVPALVIAAIVLGAVIYLVYLAPALLAELLLDAGLAAGLYRRLSTLERRSWLDTAVRRTILPVCFVGVLLAFAGLVMQSRYPDAVSIGAVVDALRRDAASKPRATS